MYKKRKSRFEISKKVGPLSYQEKIYFYNRIYCKTMNIIIIVIFFIHFSFIFYSFFCHSSKIIIIFYFFKETAYKNKIVLKVKNNLKYGISMSPLFLYIKK